MFSIKELNEISDDLTAARKLTPGVDMKVVNELATITGYDNVSDVIQCILGIILYKVKTKKVDIF